MRPFFIDFDRNLSSHVYDVAQSVLYGVENELPAKLLQTRLSRTYLHILLLYIKIQIHTLINNNAGLIERE